MKISSLTRNSLVNTLSEKLFSLNFYHMLSLYQEWEGSSSKRLSAMADILRQIGAGMWMITWIPVNCFSHYLTSLLKI